MIEEAFVCYEKGTHNSRGFGFVTFVNKDDYKKCLETPVLKEEMFELRCSAVSLGKADDRRDRRSRR